MSIIVFEEITLSVIESSDHGSILSSKDTALGYGCSEATIRNNLKNHKDELIEGKHFIIDRSYKNTPKTMWTLEGVYMLGFFIKSEQAKTFRMYVSKLLTELRSGNATIISQEQYDLLKETIIQQNAQIAQLTIELKAKPKRLPPKPKISLSESNLLLDLIGQIAREIDEDERIEEIKRKRREKKKRFFYAFVKSMNHSGITEQSQRRSEEF